MDLSFIARFTRITRPYLKPAWVSVVHTDRYFILDSLFHIIVMGVI